MSKPERQLDLVLEGPAAAGRLSVDYLATLAKELQSTLRRIARNRPVSPGRFGKEIEQACQLELVSFERGSVHLGFALAEGAPQTLFSDLGQESLDRLVSAMQSGATGDPDWAADLPPAVLDGIDRITRPLANGITSMRFETYGNKARSVTLNRAFRNRIQAGGAVSHPPDFVRVTGVIWEADWKDHTAELHEVDGNVIRIVFDPDREEDITDARKCRVTISGVGKKSGGRVNSLVLERLEIFEPEMDDRAESASRFWEAPTIAQLAEEQGVQPHEALDDLAGDWPEDESLDEFLDMVHRDRD